MCFNLKFCVAIKHHPLNIPHFFQIFLKLQNIFFSWFSPVSTECWFPYDIPPPPLRARSESCVLTGQSPNPMDRTCAPLDAPKSNDNPQPFQYHMQYTGKHYPHASC